MILCFVGIPLSGKTTVAKYVAEKYDAFYLSTGALFRKLNKIGEDVSKTDLSLVYDREIRRIVLAECLIQKDIVIDGYPRSVNQLNELMELEKGFRIVYVYTPLPIVVDRALKRNRDWQDTRKRVINRAKAAMQLWREIRDRVPTEKLLYYCDVEDDDNVLEEFVREAFNVPKFHR
jgi:adenylate kinase family enzyme